MHYSRGMNIARPSLRPFAPLLLVLLAALLPAAPAQAESTRGGAPALYGVTEILVNYTRITDPKASEACGIRRNEVEERAHEVLEDMGLTALRAATAKPALTTAVRITLTPEITTYNDGTLVCASYIELVAEGRHAARLPPVEERRNFTVTYWREGLMLGTRQSVHDQGILQATEKLARSFVTDFNVAQPYGRKQKGEARDTDRQKQDALMRQLRDKAQGAVIRRDEGPNLSDLVPDAAANDGAETPVYKDFSLQPAAQEPAGGAP
ncbi:MAG: hypothetical protein GC131_06240 [Alphaproteobacteria bacterium]|nr:hypothetical protein [Alphaproteobacteria bacterium]